MLKEMLASRPVFKPTIRVAAADLLEIRTVEDKPEKPKYMVPADVIDTIREAVRDRYGDDAAAEYTPGVTVRPRTTWLEEGYLINDGEVALCFIHTYRNGVKLITALFHERQVSLRG